MKQLQIDQIGYEDWMKLQSKISSLENKIEDLKNHQPTDDFLMTREQVADYFMVSLPTVHEWMKAGILHSYRIANRRRFKKAEIQAALVPQSNRRELKKLVTNESKAPVKKFAAPTLIHSDVKKTNIPTIELAEFERLMRNMNLNSN